MSDSLEPTIIKSILEVTTYLINEREKYRDAWNSYNEFTKLIRNLHDLIDEIRDTSTQTNNSLHRTVKEEE